MMASAVSGEKKMLLPALGPSFRPGPPWTKPHLGSLSCPASLSPGFYDRALPSPRPFAAAPLLPFLWKLKGDTSSEKPPQAWQAEVRALPGHSLPGIVSCLHKRARYSLPKSLLPRTGRMWEPPTPFSGSSPTLRSHPDSFLLSPGLRLIHHQIPSAPPSKCTQLQPLRPASTAPAAGPFVVYASHVSTRDPVRSQVGSCPSQMVTPDSE